MIRHICLYSVLLFAAGGACMALCGYFASVGSHARSIALLLGALICLASLVAILRLPVQMMSSFIGAMENDDRTMKFKTECDSREIMEISESMDRIMELYRKNRMELETRKLYYDRILRVMTHEMRNSITPVIALSKDYSAHPDKYDTTMLSETMDVIGSQSESIKKFLDSYYNLTHLPAPQRTEVRIPELLNRLRTLVDLEERQRGFAAPVCRYHIPQNMTLNVDSDLILQALMNLIRNALDAVENVKAPEIAVTVSVSEGIPFINISDNGGGIPDTVRANLFQPFITTKAGGSGIGLSLSRQIARLHDGDITVADAYPRGTSVTLTLG